MSREKRVKEMKGKEFRTMGVNWKAWRSMEIDGKDVGTPTRREHLEAAAPGRGRRQRVVGEAGHGRGDRANKGMCRRNGRVRRTGRLDREVGESWGLDEGEGTRTRGN